MSGTGEGNPTGTQRADQAPAAAPAATDSTPSEGNSGGTPTDTRRRPFNPNRRPQNNTNTFKGN